MLLGFVLLFGFFFVLFWFVVFLGFVFCGFFVHLFKFKHTFVPWIHLSIQKNIQ